MDYYSCCYFNTHMHCTCNWLVKPFTTLPGIILDSKLNFVLRALACMSVSPQVINSSRASWMNEYWAYIHVQCDKRLYKYVHTIVWTIRTLCVLMRFTKPYTLTEVSLWILSSIESSVINVPVLPTPALQWTSRGGPVSLLWPLCVLRINAINDVANFGTPWSGHAVKWYWVTLRGWASVSWFCVCVCVCYQTSIHTLC